MKFPSYEKVSNLLRNRYFIASLIFFTWILFFDKNNLTDHVRNIQKMKNLEKQKEFYKERIRIDMQKLDNLNSGTENLERFAREQYYMTRPGEEVFIIVEK